LVRWALRRRESRALVSEERERFRERMAAICDRIDAAATAAGRAPADVRLIAVSKYAELHQIRAAIEAGHRDFGENYVKDAFEKMDELGSAAAGVRWHMIGGLQSNKAARAAERFDLIHSLTSIKAAKAMARTMQSSNRACRALVQIHLGGGAQRAGLATDEARVLVEEVGTLEGIELDGVMGVAPAGEDPRRHFAVLRETLDALRELAVPNAPMRELSAGMSGDFEDAVREGATLVRVGGALFAP